MSLRNVVWAALAMAAAAGCQKTAKVEPAIPHYLQSPQALADIRRVVLIEPAPGEFPPGVVKDLTVSLGRAMGSRQVFQVDVVSVDDPALAGIGADGRCPTLEQMQRLRQACRCDAVMIASLVNFHPYPRMQMGLRVQLLDLRSGQLVWSVDHTWDGSEEATAKRIQQYHTTRTKGACQPLEWRVALVSPKAFGEFVAADVARALPSPGWASR